MIKLPKPWRKLQRHPLSGEYHDIAGTQWERFVENIKSHGVIGKRAITLAGGQILDGWQLYRACLEANVKPKFQELPKGITPEAFVETMNDLRRHETEEAAVKRITARAALVAELKAAGNSNRAIASKVGVSESQVRSDLASSGAHRCAPDLQDVQGETQTDSSKTSNFGTVTGLDGKTYPATKTAAEKLADTSDAEPEADPTPEEAMAAHNSLLESWCRDLMKFAKTMPDDPWLQDLNRREGALQKLRDVCSTIRSAKCSFICPKCEGEGCKTCHKTGRLTKYAKESL